MSRPPSFATVARYVWSYYRRQPFWLAVVIAGIMLQAASETLAPWLIGKLVDHISHGANAKESLTGAWWWLLWIGVSGWVFWITRQCTHFAYDYRLKFPAMRDIGVEAFTKVQQFSADWHANSFAGALVTKIKRGINASERFADTFYINFVPLFFLMAGLITLTAWRWPSVGLFFLILCLAYGILGTWLVARYDAPLAKIAADLDTELGATLADSLSCNATVKAFAAEGREDNHFYRVIERWRNGMWKHYMTGNVIYLFQSLFMNSIKLALFGSVIWLWSQGKATVGDIAFIITAYGLMQGYLRDIGYQLRHVQIAAKDMEDVTGYCLTPPQVPDKEGARALQVPSGGIVFNAVSFGYHNTSGPLFNQFGLAIAPQEKVALVGHSGSGKSTFVKLLLRLYEVEDGTIEIDGQNIASVTQASLRQQIALVPQDPALFHRSLADNISYGFPDATREEIEDAARKAHAHEFIATLPLGYETLVGERGVKLSGGERQRVAIARAILAQTPILVMDEATSSLDSESEALIQDALTHVFAQKTVIVIAHRLSTIRRVNRIVVMEQGRIAEQGSHEELLALRDGYYRRLYEKQAGGFLPD